MCAGASARLTATASGVIIWRRADVNAGEKTEVDLWKEAFLGTVDEDRDIVWFVSPNVLRPRKATPDGTPESAPRTLPPGAVVTPE